jgi:hypothetical protein
MNNAKLYLDGKLISEASNISFESKPSEDIEIPASEVYEVKVSIMPPTRDDRLRAVFRVLDRLVGPHWLVARVGGIEAKVPAFANDTPETFMDRALAMLEEAAKARSGVATPGQNVDTGDNA